MGLRLRHHFQGEVQGFCTQKLRAGLGRATRRKQASHRREERSCTYADSHLLDRVCEHSFKYLQVANKLEKVPALRSPDISHASGNEQIACFNESSCSDVEWAADPQIPLPIGDPLQRREGSRFRYKRIDGCLDCLCTEQRAGASNMQVYERG